MLKVVEQGVEEQSESLPRRIIAGAVARLTNGAVVPFMAVVRSTLLTAAKRKSGATYLSGETARTTDEVRDKECPVRMNAAEHATLTDAAKRHGFKNLSMWVRRVLLVEAAKVGKAKK